MQFYNNILETIGNTPLIKLNSVVETDALVLAKIESFNPGHSTKDRMALKMIEDAEKEGVISAGATIIEGTVFQTFNTIIYLKLVILTIFKSSKHCLKFQIKFTCWTMSLFSYNYFS